ncbi:hypothetical protein GGS21DRAFT_544993 [Xylaria nigripes]|nr:hypothetical protein GGS21DRAFT_544993 [Xylaria nigripes]
MSVLNLMKDDKAHPSAHNHGHLIYVPAWIFVFFCPVVVGTRIWSRKRTGLNLGPDDYTILASLVFAVATDIILLWGCYYGYGKHAASLTAHEKYEAFKAFYFTQITYKTSINLTKASILLLYLRIFGGVKWFRWTCLCLLAMVASYCIAAIMGTIFQCIPVVAAFDKNITHKKCINNEHFWFANAGFSISTDVVILILPMPLVYSLQIPRVQKAALVFVFALGAFVVITSCLRATTLDLQATSRDPLYDVASTMWTIIEMSVAIICACLPQIRPLAVKLFPKIMPAYYNAKERQSHRASFAGSLMRLDSGHHEQPSEDNGCQDSIKFTNLRKSDSSEMPLSQEDKRDSKGIQKTTLYSVEYSNHGKETEV